MNTKEFLEKVEQDAKENNFTIIEKIQTAGKNPEVVYAIAKENGLTDSFEAFEAEMIKQSEAMSGELSDEELLSVAGGESTGFYVTMGITGTGTIAAMGFLASAV